MQNFIYKTDGFFIAESFNLGHSVLRFTEVDNDFFFEFQGMYYIEMPRIFNGVEIWKMTEKEKEDFLLRRPKLEGKSNFWKILSDNETYYVVALGISINGEFK